MEDRKLLLIGGGGHCKSVISSLNAKEYSDVGIIDPSLCIGTKVMGIKVIGNDHDLPALKKEGYRFAFISMGSIGETSLRRKLYTEALHLGFQMVNIIDKTAVLDNTVKMGNGIFVGKNAVINTESEISNGCIINTGAIIEHECFIGKFTHVAPGAVICGDCYIDDDVHIGANTCIKQGIKIEKGVMVGMGSVVINNVLKQMKIFGNPANTTKRED